MPEEIREQMRELFEAYESGRMSGGLPPPNVVMFEHALTTLTLSLMRGTSEEGID